MAPPEIGLASMTHHPPNPPNPNSSSSASWMWNPREHPEDDDSWEVRAFAEDTRNVMGTTWPPRSYTCTFCRREFRSAQALGGHMNVHRRDRARLHQVHPNSCPTSSFVIPTQDLLPNAGLCLLYRLPTPNNPTFTFGTTPTPSSTACEESPSTLLSISPLPPNNFDFPVLRSGCSISSYSSSTKVELPTNASNDGHEELDLELRLGHRPTPT